MRIFMSLLTGLIVLAGTAGALTAWFLALLATPALADSPGSFLAKFIGPAYIAAVCLFIYLTYLAARGVYRHYDRRIAGSMNAGHILAALLALPLVIALFFQITVGASGAILVIAVSVIAIAAILAVFGVVARFIPHTNREQAPAVPAAAPRQAP
ncbi:MAG: hypothetical protein PHV33_09885 [Elusimicrobiales bacterium]|nr:hypothetical protein [Elusimicrobiales bacterium]